MLSTVGSTLCVSSCLTSIAMPRNRNYSHIVWTVDTQRGCQLLEATQLVSSGDSIRTLASLTHALNLISASLLCPAQGTSRISGVSIQGVHVCELFKSRKTPRNHRCFRSPSGGFIPPSGTRELVAKKGLQGDHDQPRSVPGIAARRLLPRGSQAPFQLREPQRPAGGVKSERSQAPAPAWKGMQGMGLCPGKY